MGAVAGIACWDVFRARVLLCLAEGLSYRDNPLEITWALYLEPQLLADRDLHVRH